MSRDTHNRVDNWMVLLCVLLGSASANAAEQQLLGPSTLPTPGGLSSGPFIGPYAGGPVAVRRAGTTYLRHAPGKWDAQDETMFSDWTPYEGIGDFRLLTGEKVRDAVRVGDLWLGRIGAGVVESRDGFRTLSAAAVRFGRARVVAVAKLRATPGGDVNYWVATDANELSRCDKQACKSILIAPITSLRSFEDGADLAGDAEGGVWRLEDSHWIRQSVGEDAIIRLDGVADGGPRYAHTRKRSFVSQDHGVTWQQTSNIESQRAFGPGGRSAWRDDKGKLQLQDENGLRTVHTDPAIPLGAAIVFASSDVVVIGLDVGVLAVNRLNDRTRFLRYPDTGQHRLHTAHVVGEELQVIAGERLADYRGEAESSWEVERFAESLEGESGFFLAVFIVTIGVFLFMFEFVFRRNRSIRGSD